MSRTKLICGNWKLHKTVAESVELATAIKNAVGPIRDIEVAVAPVFTALYPVAKRLEGSAVALAAQDCFWEDQGAWTGEVSCKLLKDVGCKYVIIAHSERRQHFGELDASANLKVKAALKNGLDPILCVGETLAERDAGEAFHVVARHLAGGLADLSADDGKRLVIAYEPVWAIGTGRTATPQQAQEMHEFIRGKLAEQFGDVAETIRIQYGGSVKPDNAALLMEQADIDGALVGGASLKADDFLKIVKYRNS
ncbi:MAG TPA: triose-phosphate isomerase [Polyangia bacterium]|nr:triose-phosphate isomerase [Polyangia bacterium]